MSSKIKDVVAPKGFDVPKGFVLRLFGSKDKATGKTVAEINHRPNPKGPMVNLAKYEDIVIAIPATEETITEYLSEVEAVTGYDKEGNEVRLKGWPAFCFQNIPGTFEPHRGFERDRLAAGGKPDRDRWQSLLLGILKMGSTKPSAETVRNIVKAKEEKLGRALTLDEMLEAAGIK